MKITANVGDHSTDKEVPNKYNDVIVVQKLLNNAATKTGNKAFQSSVPPDGKIHSTPSKSATVKAINNFQKLQLKFSNPDGIVEPNGKTFAALVKLGATASVVIQNTNYWDWPLDSNQIRRGMVNHTFGMVRKYADGRKKPHQGWDFYAVPGTQCYAIADGVVHQVRNHGDYGRQVVLKHKLKGNVIYSHYAHLKSSSVTVGEMVQMGQKIAKTGNTGNAKSMKGLDQHLHFEIRNVASVGRGLAGRQSPKTVFGICPMKSAEVRKYKGRAAHEPCYINPDGPKLRRGLQML